MQTKTKLALLFFLAIATVTFSGCGCKSTNTKQYSLKLEVWGLFDDRDAFSKIIENYKKLNPNIGDIEYKKMSVDNYQQELVDALASGKGPDIFLIGSSWVPKFKDKIAPAPDNILNEQKFRKDFVDVAASDFINQGKIYAAPLTVDSLQLFYNKDLFNSVGITNPPADWNQFVEDVKKLTKISRSGEIVQSGAAIGTAYNINRSTDILGLLMLQNRTEMVNAASRRAMFDQGISNGSATVFPGENALSFYTSFARINSSLSNYTWNSGMHYSIDAFSEGTAAMMFNYSWTIDTVVSKAPKLNFAVAPVPQLNDGSKIGYANYWGYAVAVNKVATLLGANQATAQLPNDTRVAEAWNFLRFMTTKSDQNISISANVAGSNQVVDSNFDPAISYLEKTKKPAARRDLIEIQKTDPKIGVFASGNLIAKSWYQPDTLAVEGIFATMIDQVNKGRNTITEAIKAANVQVTQLMN